MNKKDISIIKRNAIGTKEENTSIKKIAVCYVDNGRNELILQGPETFGLMEEEVISQYLSFAKKGLTGAIGEKILDVKVSDEDKFKALIKSGLNDKVILNEVSKTVADSLDIVDNYSILYTYGVYDVPNKIADSEVVYEFIQIMIMPCPLSKPGLVFDYPDKSFVDRKKERAMESPMYSITYPCFEDMLPDRSKAIFMAKNSNLISSADSLLEELCGTTAPTDADMQKTIFKTIVEQSFGDIVPYEDVQRIYDNIVEQQVNDLNSGEEKKYTVRNLAEMILKNTDLPTEKQNEILQEAEKNADSEISLANIIPKTVTVSTGTTKMRIDADNLCLIKRQTIEGREYLLIPADATNIDGVFVH